MTDSGPGHGVCGCRGTRSCGLCEGETRKLASSHDTDGLLGSLYQCYKCGKADSIEDCPEDLALAPLHACREPCRTATVLHSSSITSEHLDTPLEGVTVVKEFVSPEDELAILAAIDGQSWSVSQSGRRKQVRGSDTHDTHTHTHAHTHTHSHRTMVPKSTSNARN